MTGDGRYLDEALEDRDAGPARRLRRRLERLWRLVRNPQQWSADRYRRSDMALFAAALRGGLRERPFEADRPVADPEAPE